MEAVCSSGTSVTNRAIQHHIPETGNCCENLKSNNICIIQQIVFGKSNKEVIWAGHVAREETLKNSYNILVGKPEGKRPLSIPRRR
jgi:hypothetical protein